ncbi:MAG: hypothetical protein HYR96_02580, partial [Deltaproteobacteria bacterium]|nr:hypothetical protein [Deltaproteobacteria bacterium]
MVYDDSTNIPQDTEGTIGDGSKTGITGSGGANGSNNTGPTGNSTTGTTGTTGTNSGTPAGWVRLYRAYNKTQDYHFFTKGFGEFTNAVNHGYRDETTGRNDGFCVQSSPVAATSASGSVAAVPLHRLYNPNNGRHYYTIGDGEKSFLVGKGWKYEHDEGYIYPSQVNGTTEVFRLYNRNSGAHLYTVDPGVKNSILARFPGIWEQHGSLGYAAAYTIQYGCNTPTGSYGASPGIRLREWAKPALAGFTHLPILRSILSAWAAPSVAEPDTLSATPESCIINSTGTCAVTLTLLNPPQGACLYWQVEDGPAKLISCSLTASVPFSITSGRTHFVLLSSDSNFPLLASISVRGKANTLPIGYFDGVNNGLVRGWAYDPDVVPASISVQLFIGGPAGSPIQPQVLLANQSRPDVNANRHVAGNFGFSLQLPASGLNRPLYAYAIDANDSTKSTFLGSYFPPPTGSINATAISGVTDGTGYCRATINWSSTAAPDATVYLKWTGTSAAHEYAHKSSGSQTAPQLMANSYVFELRAERNAGSQLLSSVSVACVANKAPIGNLDSVSTLGVVSGWAADPDVPGKVIPVHIYANDKFIQSVSADQLRTDANNAFGLSGGHGFSFQLPQSYAGQSIKVYAIDNGGNGPNPLLNGSPKTLINLPPIGNFDGISSTGVISGWAADQNTPSSPIFVHIYANGKFIQDILADRMSSSGAENQTFGLSGGHRFSFQLPPNLLGQSILIYAIDASFTGPNPVLNGSAKIYANLPPIGNFDGISSTGVISGWAADQNVPNTPILVHIYANDKFVRSIVADQLRTDANNAFGLSGGHGFSF